MLFKISDSLLSFSKNVKVGMSRTDFEKFLGYSINAFIKANNDGMRPLRIETHGNKTTVQGTIEWTDAPEYNTVIITFEKDLVTEISMELFAIQNEGALSKKAVNVFNSKAKEMGLSTINNN